MKYTKDYYETLGVKPKATSAEIRRAYHRLAILYHPDRNPTPQANAKMQEINEAYGVLGNQDKRTEYDSERPALIVDPLPGNPSSYGRKETSSGLSRFLILGGMSFFGLLVFLMAMIRFLGTTSAFTAFLFVVGIALLLMIAFLILLRLSNDEKEESRPPCPQCQEVRAGEKTRDELVGIFRKSVSPFVQLRGGSNSRRVLHEKYKIYYKCKYCGFEWVGFRVEQVEETPIL
jgi:hypothetical protein